MGIASYAKKKWQEHEVARITGNTRRRKQNQEIKKIADAAAFKERKRTAAAKAVAYEKSGGFWGSVSKGMGNLADNLDKNTRKKGKGKNTRKKGKGKNTRKKGKGKKRDPFGF